MYAIAQMSILRTGFFHADRKLHTNELRSQSEQESQTQPEHDPLDSDYGDPLLKTGNPEQDFIGRLQHGAVRTNCIDSIDRTNAAQYLLGLCALSHQLYTIGIIQSPDELTFDSAISLVLMEMYEIAGHQLALQYGGSGLAHTMNTFVTKSIVDHSKDFWTVVQRYYRNAFTDQEKQHTMNVFLGVYKPWEHKNATDLWSLESDYHLHMYDHERELLYAHKWWVEPLLQHQGIYRRTTLPTLSIELEETKSAEKDSSYEDFHSVHKLSSFDKILSKEFMKQRKVTASIPQPIASPKHEKEKSGIGIMGWLWSSKSPSPIVASLSSSSLRVNSYNTKPINPLEWCGMDLVEDPISQTKYAAHCDVAQLSHRVSKKRKRYNYYKKHCLLTHYRRPKIGTD
jgi:hypothetical protein